VAMRNGREHMNPRSTRSTTGRKGPMLPGEA
jgi:hypothetical protein